MAELVSSEELAAQSNTLKLEGNAYIAANRFALAAEKYSDAIDLFPTAVLYSNRAQAFIKLESFGLAIADADAAIR
jgi:serine/threonine-protein phosphatase 5